MPQSLTDRRELLEHLVVLARDAGTAIMKIYAGDIAVSTKSDASPVTAADAAAEAVILPQLARLAPDIPAVSEEAVETHGAPPIGATFWLVDPLDGTKEFINRNGEFTVNIALIENGQPVLGVVHAPALDRLFAGVVGDGAFTEEAGVRRHIACRLVPDEGLTVVASRSHGNPDALAKLLNGRKVAHQSDAGSSLKFCMVASGQADVYPRLGRTMEWDTAAGQAVVMAAGGFVKTLDGDFLTYGKPGLDNPYFIAAAKALD
jgi:3'(2'), 5'-bisphosphate nucleotidase